MAAQRSIRVLFDDGESLVTSINGSVSSIMNYYIGVRFTKFDETHRTCVDVEFLDGPLQRGEWLPMYFGNWFRPGRQLRDRLRTEVYTDDLFQSVDSCQAECDRLNGAEPALRFVTAAEFFGSDKS